MLVSFMGYEVYMLPKLLAEIFEGEDVNYRGPLVGKTADAEHYGRWRELQMAGKSQSFNSSWLRKLWC